MPRNNARWLDGLAIGASGMCLLHCLALPVAIALLPGLMASVAAAEWVHVALLLFAAPTSAAALAIGHSRHARSVVPLLGAGGLVLMAAALGEPLEHIETPLTVVGSLLLAAAHIANWRLQAVMRN